MTRVWLFDLDNTLHDASHAAFGHTGAAMTDYMVTHLGIEASEATRLRELYWTRYGATLLGLVRHHRIDAAHFLAQTHLHPGLEARLRASRHDRVAVKRLVGRKYVLTNAPRTYTSRVLNTLRLADLFDGVISIEDMSMFGHLRPKPDLRMFRALTARLKVKPTDCVLVEDMLDNQKAAHRLGMRTAWMQRYLGGRYRGDLLSPVAVSASNSSPGDVSVDKTPPRRVCPSPRYVTAKIRTLRELIALE